MRPSILWLVFVCFALLPQRLFASAPDDATLAAIARSGLATGVAPGLALAVVSHGQIVYESGYGFADLASRVPVDPRTRFAIGSLTKQFTAAAIELLAREGRISLDDPLAKYVPSLPNARQITLRMLLDQTSGLQNYPKPPATNWPARGPVSLDRILALLATERPDFKPGTRWEYSNANYTALAAVVQKVAGVPFATFLQSRIFFPLRMADSGFGYAAQKSGTIATGYIDGKADPQDLSLDVTSGAGAIVSTAHDLALWDIGLLHGRLLFTSYLDDVWREGVPTGDGDRYMAGWVIANVAGHRELWHNGLVIGIGGYCYNAIFPDDGLAIVILTNGAEAAGVPERMAQSIAAAYGIGTAPVSPAKPTPSSNDDSAIDALARAFWDQIASGTVDRSKLTPDFSAALTPSLVAQVAQGITLMGTLRSFTFVGTRTGLGDFTTYRYSLVFASGAVHEWDVAITSDRRIAGSRLVQ